MEPPTGQNQNLGLLQCDCMPLPNSHQMRPRQVLVFKWIFVPNLIKYAFKHCWSLVCIKVRLVSEVGQSGGHKRSNRTMTQWLWVMLGFDIDHFVFLLWAAVKLYTSISVAQSTAEHQQHFSLQYWDMIICPYWAALNQIQESDNSAISSTRSSSSSLVVSQSPSFPASLHSLHLSPSRLFLTG